MLTSRVISRIKEVKSDPAFQRKNYLKLNFYFSLLLCKVRDLRPYIQVSIRINIADSHSSWVISVDSDSIPPGQIGLRNRFLGSSTRAGIFKPLWSPGIDAKASTPPVYVAWRAGTITLFLVGA
jgi:hypothetical protein